LRCGEGQFGVRTAQGPQTHLGQPPVQDLALGHQLLHRAGDIFDRHRGIGAVLVQQIDLIRPQAFEHLVDGQLDAVGKTVEARSALSSLEVDGPPELRRDRDLVAKRCDTFAQDAFNLCGREPRRRRRT
jgi:hypothetical protein